MIKASSNQFEKFVVLTAPLDGLNLVEASAGTGKTYSIGLLVLRLMIEKQLKLKEILLVTFTNAATAELEERIRLFIRMAYNFALGKEIGNPEISNIVENAIKNIGKDEVSEILKDAVHLLDEKSIFTINGFSQRILSEFAVETGQYLNTQLILDGEDLILEKAREYWRNNIAVLPVELLSELQKLNQLPNLIKIVSAVKSYLNGIPYIDYSDDGIKEDLSILLSDTLNTIQDGSLKLEEAKNKFEQLILENEKEHKKLLGISSRTLVKTILANPEKMQPIAELKTHKPLYNAYSSFIGLTNNKLSPNHLSKIILHDAIHKISASIEIYKHRLQLSTFNDFINNLHKILQQPEASRLKSEVQKRYKAVFVDEFQDTDVKQFEIFKNLFDGSDTLMYFIGDPKQSIYEFRGGDVDNYLRSRKKMTRLFSMNTNYRSADVILEAVNRALLPYPEFDTFHYGDEAERINYHNVEAPKGNGKPSLLFKGQPMQGITVYACDKAENAKEDIAIQVSNLLRSGAYALKGNGEARPVNPRDIAILCRSNNAAADIRSYLRDLKIPAVINKSITILETKEATEFCFLIDAIANPSMPRISKTMLSGFFGLNSDMLPRLDESKLIQLFSAYKNTWIEQGPYPALIALVNDFGLRNKLLNESGSGEKTIANLYQLIEMVNDHYNKTKSGIDETIAWFKKISTAQDHAEDEYLQRLETDEDAVRIETIHKSKGLEYNIVLCHGLEFRKDNTRKEFTYKDADGNKKYGDKDLFTSEELNRIELYRERENRRLLYVAITRAASHLFIFHNTYQADKTTVRKFFDPETWPFESVEELPAAKKTAKQPATRVSDVIIKPKVGESGFSRLSYTWLSGDHEITPKEKSAVLEDSYENFINHTLNRGNLMGSMLHELFENVRWQSDEYWHQHIHETASRYGFVNLEESRINHFQILLQHALNAVIQIGDSEAFTLQQVPNQQKVNELKFNFPIKNFSPSGLLSLAHDLMPLSIRTEADYLKDLNGFVNGAIDLFFKHGDKYYILDWKSNYLGPSLQFYSQKHLQASMDENNYHLQYLVYAVAAKKYLQARIPNFDFDKQFGGIIYLFLRGARSGNNTGVFTIKPNSGLLKRLEQIIS